MSFRLAFTIGSDTRYLAPLRRMVRAAASVVGSDRFPETAQKAVTLALIEAVDNAIFHAHNRRADLPIRVVLSANARRIRVDVGDTGNGIERLFVEPPPESSTRGRGLFLIRSMVDEVESVKKNGTHWMRMTYRL